MAPLQLLGQNSHARVRVLYPTNDTIQLDTLSIVPGSERIQCYAKGLLLSPQQCPVLIDYWESRLILGRQVLPDSIEISYTVFPLNFAASYYHKDPENLRQADLDLTPYETRTTSSYDPFSELNELNYNGSLVRGLSFGNNQDVVLNSSFNLQMSGLLQNEVEISAAITDNNIPIQPEGNTQQLQEFDKVFIRLAKDDQSLIVGDFDLLRPNDYFLNYYKRTQGASYAGLFQLENGSKIQTGISAAVARGLYTRQTISVIEGNQGPYKLTGNNGEAFIIVLAGTERVWIDGILLTRGAENDYIIDYNAGEISFTPKQLINKDKRVQIEFEYSDRSYFRSILTQQNTYTSANQKTIWRLNLYSEQDGKNQPLDQTLDSTSRSVLAGIGDSVNQAFIPGFDTLSYDPERIMYRLTDTLGYDSVFVYSTDPESAQYVLSFTELGINKGNYILSANLANGRVYQWVQPVAGIPQGSAEPVILLRTPISRQMATIGAEFNLNEQNKLGAEIAWSRNDVNTFSEIDNADNDGLGVQINWKNNQNTDNSIKINTNIIYEYIDENFQFIERYRPVEFNRDWNILSNKRVNEHYALAQFDINNGNNWNLNLGSSAFIQESLYNGLRQSANFKLDNNSWLIQSGGSYVYGETDTAETSYLRPDISILRRFEKLGGLQAGGRYWSEHNRILQNDSLVNGSFYFDEFNLYLIGPDSSANSVQTEFIYRKDGLPVAGKFDAANEGFTWNLSGAFNSQSASRLNWLLTYRNLHVLDTTLSTQSNENSLLGRLQHAYVAGSGWLTSDIFYEIGTGQEPKREYTYVEVEPGQGSHTWIDYNSDGIQQLNEFEIAVFSDQATYIQVFIPTSEYIQANVSQFNYALALNPKAVWNNAGQLKELISRFSTLSNLQLNRKVLDQGDLSSYAPIGNIDDSLLVSSNVYWQNTIYFNRVSSIFGMEYSWQQTTGKQVLINGPETREKKEHKLSARYRIIDPLILNILATSGTKLLASQAFTDRSYRTPYKMLEPKISFIQGSKYRISLFYTYKRSYNTEGAEALLSNSAGMDIRYNVPGNSTISSRLSFTNVNFTGIEDSPIGFAMLEGLQNGNNLIWNINFDKRLSEILQLTLAYDGRKTGSASIVHIGRVQMRAIF